ncbi:hypothetical protein ABIB95_009568 [Bradyrhizobium sp. LA2.1]
MVCHHKVSTYFGGHLMHQSTQKQKVQGNSRLHSSYRDAKLFRAPSKNADGFIEWNEDTVRQADCHCQR